MTDPQETRRPQNDRPDLRSEAPDEHGIRRGLVEHVRKLIEAGEYDSPERWAIAEERLLKAFE